MRHRLRLLLDESLRRANQVVAQRLRVTVADWIRCAPRRATGKSQAKINAKLRAIAKASRHEFPTAAIKDMLRESGR
jgi:hypothetical protein